ncbi:unnamed protein product, partial [Ixodes pacificus]
MLLLPANDSASNAQKISVPYFPDYSPHPLNLSLAERPLARLENVTRVAAVLETARAHSQPEEEGEP